VTFEPEGRPAVTGMLTRYNKKTVTVIADGGVQWNVSPQFLRLAEEARGQGAEPRDVNVVPMHKK